MPETCDITVLQHVDVILIKAAAAKHLKKCYVFQVQHPVFSAVTFNFRYIESIPRKNGQNLCQMKSILSNSYSESHILDVA